MAWQWPATELPVCKQPNCMNYKKHAGYRKCSIVSTKPDGTYSYQKALKNEAY